MSEDGLVLDDRPRSRRRRLLCKEQQLNASILYLVDQSQQFRGIFSLFIWLWYISDWIFLWWVPFEFTVHDIYKQSNTVNLRLSLGLDNFPRSVLDFERGRSYPVECMTWRGASNVLITKMQLVTSKPFNTYIILW